MSARVSARWPLSVALAGAAVFANSVGNGFALDDVPIVGGDARLESLASIPALFFQPYWNVPGEQYGLYRPLVLVSLAVGRAIHGPAPWGHHLINVLLHAGVSALVWFAARRAGLHYGTAILTGLLFAVHPLHAEAVANVVGRAEMLAAAGVLGAWILHRRESRPAAAACYLAALLSKESAILAPLLFALDDSARGIPVLKRASSFSPYLAAAVVALVLRVAALGGLPGAVSAIPLDNPAAAAGPLPRIATAVAVQGLAVRLVVWPHPLCADYSLDAFPVVRSAFDPRFLGGLAVVAAVAGVLVFRKRLERPVVLAAAIWALFFLPSSNLLFPVGTLFGERLAYLPSLGACLLAGHAGASLAAKGRGRLVGAFAAAAILGGSAATVSRNPDWASNAALALHDVEVRPESAKLQAGAGIALAVAGRKDEAETRFRRAIEIYPDYAQIHYNLAVLLLERGERDEAEIHLRRAAALAPGNPEPATLLERLERSRAGQRSGSR